MFTHPCSKFSETEGVDVDHERIENDKAGIRKLSQVVKEVAGRCTVKL